MSAREVLRSSKHFMLLTEFVIGHKYNYSMEIPTHYRLQLFSKFSGSYMHSNLAAVSVVN